MLPSSGRYAAQPHHAQQQQPRCIKPLAASVPLSATCRGGGHSKKCNAATISKDASSGRFEVMCAAEAAEVQYTAAPTSEFPSLDTLELDELHSRLRCGQEFILSFIPCWTPNTLRQLAFSFPGAPWRTIARFEQFDPLFVCLPVCMRI